MIRQFLKKRLAVQAGGGSKPTGKLLRFESLEDRNLLSITVDTVIDEADGSIVDGDVSLRDAIAAAAPGETIDFAASLTSSGPASIVLTNGELVINKSLTISGPGANQLTIDATGNDPTPTQNNGDGSRVFKIDDGTTAVSEVSISGLTITGSDTLAVGGGAIQSLEDLTITASKVSGNSTAEGGGGIYQYGASLSVINSTISDNSAKNGGGIVSYLGDLTIADSTISGNVASASGGGLLTAYVNLNLNSSTVSGNSAIQYGGGLFLYYGNSEIRASTISGNSAKAGGGISSQTDLTTYTTLVVNSTISGNTASIDGGGLENYNGRMIIRFSTLTGNTAPADYGGGLASYADANTLTDVTSTIVAGNNGSDIDLISGTVNSFQSAGYNLIGSGSGAAAFTSAGDSSGVASPMLGPLAYNGGSTKTHAPLAGSPAIDGGDPAAVADIGDVPLYDQRGNPLGRVFDGDGSDGARLDIGAVEFQPVPPNAYGDYNHNGVVDGADYVVWRNTLGQSTALYGDADGNGDQVVDQDDYVIWRANFGTVVPPAAASGAQLGMSSGGADVGSGSAFLFAAPARVDASPSPTPRAIVAAAANPAAAPVQGMLASGAVAVPATDQRPLAAAPFHRGRSLNSSPQFGALHSAALMAWLEGRRAPAQEDHSEPSLSRRTGAAEDLSEMYLDAAFASLRQSLDTD